MLFMKPLDKDRLTEVFDQQEIIVTIEEGVLRGGFGSAVMEYAEEIGKERKVNRIGIQDQFIGHGSLEELKQLAGLDRSSLKEKLEHLLSNLKSDSIN